MATNPLTSALVEVDIALVGAFASKFTGAADGDAFVCDFCGHGELLIWYLKIVGFANLA